MTGHTAYQPAPSRTPCTGCPPELCHGEVVVTRPTFPQIEEADAAGDLAAAYTEMRATLRVPWVMFAARALAVFGGFVPAAWQAAQPVFATRGLEAAADEIRDTAVMSDPAPPDPRPSLARAGIDEDTSLPAIRAALDALNYGNPKYLLLITAWCEGIQGRSSGGTQTTGGPRPRPRTGTGTGTGPPPAGFDTAPLPSGTPAGMPVLHLVDPAAASETVAGLLAEITDAHFHHGPASDFRVLANWPDALSVLHHEVLAPVVRTEAYDRTARALLDLARTRVAAFPAPAGLTAEQVAAVCSDTERAAVTAMLAMFQRFILDVTIDAVRLAHALTEPSTPPPPRSRPRTGVPISPRRGRGAPPRQRARLRTGVPISPRLGRRAPPRQRARRAGPRRPPRTRTGP